MRNIVAVAVLLVLSLGLSSAPAGALQTIVPDVDENADGTMTYHFSVKLGQAETLAPAAGKAPADFVTVYDFYGLVEGSAKSPDGWEFSSEEFGRIPTLNGNPLTLARGRAKHTQPHVDGDRAHRCRHTDQRFRGFAAMTRVAPSVQGEYSAQVTRQSPETKVAAGPPSITAGFIKQALIGLLPTPSFLTADK